MFSFTILVFAGKLSRSFTKTLLVFDTTAPLSPFVVFVKVLIENLTASSSFALVGSGVVRNLIDWCSFVKLVTSDDTGNVDVPCACFSSGF